MELIAEIKIFSKEDRKTVAGILVDNGYTVGTGKRQKTPNGKSVDYTLKLYADDVAAKFDYWWDIASGKTQQEAEDDDAKRNDEPTLSERVDTLESAFMEFVKEVLNG